MRAVDRRPRGPAAGPAPAAAGIRSALAPRRTRNCWIFTRSPAGLLAGHAAIEGEIAVRLPPPRPAGRRWQRASSVRSRIWPMRSVSCDASLQAHDASCRLSSFADAASRRSERCGTRGAAVEARIAAPPFEGDEQRTCPASAMIPAISSSAAAAHGYARPGVGGADMRNFRLAAACEAHAGPGREPWLSRRVCAQPPAPDRAAGHRAGPAGPARAAPCTYTGRLK